MSLSPGARLGPFEIVSQIGAGGMGEVYRAHDTKLGRDVAIKVLPQALTADSERRIRFEREALLLASLNHPNIATIHGIEQIDGVQAIVLELIAGDTLHDRLIGGRLPVGETLGYALQITKALEAAHEKGVIHRDVKPRNIKITPNGTVKVLDFGLAKLDGNRVDAPTNSPTITIGGTQHGVVLGTAAYMSPEQARGLTIDKRTDVWAFGCVLYEMLTGRPPFDGENTTDVLARVIEREPDFERLPSDIPAAIRRLVRRTLTKDPHNQLADISDARMEIEDAVADAKQVVPVPVAARRPVRTRIATVLLSLVTVVAIAAFMYGRRPGPEPTPVRFSITPPAGVAWSVPGVDTVIAVSPDGRRLAYSGRGEDGRTSLWIRPLDALESLALAGTEGAISPFWSSRRPVDWLFSPTAN